MGTIQLTGIHIYPIKSCHGVSRDSATVTPIGLAGDRLWQVVTDEARGTTQRKHRVLATVQPLLIDGGGLELSAPERERITIGPPGEPNTTAESHFGVPVPVFDAGELAASWFSDILGKPARLVAMAEGSGWRLPDDLDIFDQNAPFTDAAPVLVASQASLDWLVSQASEPFEMARFRPNLVISGSLPWEEDTWSEFSIGTVKLKGIAPWPRCTIPQIDQQTGERHKEPAKVLRKHRWCIEAPTIAGPFRKIIEGSGLFGLACSIAPVGSVLNVGDQITIESTVAPLLSMN